MGFFQRNLPIILLAIALALIALGVFGFVQTQRELPSRDFTILVDEQGSGYYRVAETYHDLLKLLRHKEKLAAGLVEEETLPPDAGSDIDINFEIAD